MYISVLCVSSSQGLKNPVYSKTILQSWDYSRKSVTFDSVLLSASEKNIYITLTFKHAICHLRMIELCKGLGWKGP